VKEKADIRGQSYLIWSPHHNGEKDFVGQRLTVTILRYQRIVDVFRLGFGVIDLGYTVGIQIAGAELQLYRNICRCSGRFQYKAVGLPGRIIQRRKGEGMKPEIVNGRKRRRPTKDLNRFRMIC